jgi:transcription elongation factor SPT6
VDNAHSYADLDELIVNHVQAMARRAEDLKRHDRFKYGTEDELRESWPVHCGSSFNPN